MDFAIFVEYPWIYDRIYDRLRTRTSYPLIMEPMPLEVRVRQASNSHSRCELFIYVKADVAEAWSFLLETGSVALTTHLYIYIGRTGIIDLC